MGLKGSPELIEVICPDDILERVASDPVLRKGICSSSLEPESSRTICQLFHDLNHLWLCNQDFSAVACHLEPAIRRSIREAKVEKLPELPATRVRSTLPRNTSPPCEANVSNTVYETKDVAVV